MKKKSYAMPEKEIPGDCKQLFLPLFCRHPAAMLLQANGILLSGISTATKGFKIRRTPDFYLAIFTLSGSGYFRAGKLEMQTPAHSVILTPPYVEHYYEQRGESPWIFFWVHLSRVSERWNFIHVEEPVCGHSEWISWLNFCAGSFAAEVYSLYQGQLDEAKPKALYLDLRDQAQALEQLALPVESAQHHASELANYAAQSLLIYLERDLETLLHREEIPETHQQLVLLWNRVTADLAENWTLQQMAHTAGMSVPTLIRQVKNVYHETPAQLLTRLRIRRAGQFLRDTDLTVSEIAMQVGYHNLAAFSAAFRQNFGKTPREYRRMTMIENI